MWDLPGPGIEPVSPELAGGFLTTEPPGKSQFQVYLKSFDSLKIPFDNKIPILEYDSHVSRGRKYIEIKSQKSAENRGKKR